jgi:AraC family transcriptional regulator
MPPLTRIIPALVHIQAHLDQDLSLDALASQVGLSTDHFHELFQDATGETPKAYVERLRLEWAAMQLRIRPIPVVDVAFECGYRNHETFSRAFRRRFLTSPRDYRKEWFRLEHDTNARFQRAPDQAPRGELSTTRIVRLSPLTVAFTRHLGPYEHVSPDDFARVTEWALRSDRPAGGRASKIGGAPLLIGIARDAPGITPAEKIRFDCCVQVPATFKAEGEIGCQRTPGGAHAITEYVGSWDLGPAYAEIFERLGKMTTIDIIGLPAIEIYRTTELGARDGIARVAIAIPVSLRAGPVPRTSRLEPVDDIV